MREGEAGIFGSFLNLPTQCVFILLSSGDTHAGCRHENVFSFYLESGMLLLKLQNLFLLPVLAFLWTVKIC